MQTFSKQYINGAWVESTNAGRYIDVFDSNTGKVCAKVIDGSAADTEKAIEAAAVAFKTCQCSPRGTQRRTAVSDLQTLPLYRQSCAPLSASNLTDCKPRSCSA